MKDVIDVLARLDILQLFAIGMMMWFFYSRLNSKIEKLSSETRSEIELINKQIHQQSQRSDRLYEVFLEQQKNSEQRFYDLDKRFYDLLKSQKDPKTNP